MTIRIRFRPRPVAVRQVCPACEGRRAWLRANGVRRWAPFRASCAACAERAQPRLTPERRISGTAAAAA
jgi:hypothetical protein